MMEEGSGRSKTDVSKKEDNILNKTTEGGLDLWILSVGVVHVIPAMESILPEGHPV